MGANHEERVLKRRLNEIDDQLQRLRKEIQRIRDSKKHQSRGKKQLERAVQREQDLTDIIRDYETEVIPEPKIESQYRCRKEECGSGDVKIIEAGMFRVVVCEACGARYSVREQSHDGIPEENSRKAFVAHRNAAGGVPA